MKAQTFTCPEEKWYRFSSGEKYTGSQIISVIAPLTDLPVFIKAGAIIPMQHIIQSTGDTGDGMLELHLWNGKEANSFTYYEDDGVSYDYEGDAYYKREISIDPEKKANTFIGG